MRKLIDALSKWGGKASSQQCRKRQTFIFQPGLFKIKPGQAKIKPTSCSITFDFCITIVACNDTNAHSFSDLGHGLSDQRFAIPTKWPPA